MWNRHGERLSITDEYAAVLAKLNASRFEWLDCEGLDNRRHRLAPRSLIVLDWVKSGLDYLERRAALGQSAWLLYAHDAMPDTADEVFITPSYQFANRESLLRFWTALKQMNQVAGCEFYEGVVCKRLTSHYPIQLRSPDEKCPEWVKHRWRF